MCVLFDVANAEPLGRSGKRMFCSLGKEKINLKCELKPRSSARPKTLGAPELSSLTLMEISSVL